MSTRTEEVSSAVKTAGNGMAEARTHAERLTEIARDKAETAAAHGWAGVATTMEQAVEHLETASEQLSTAETSGRTAATALDEITDQMSSPDVIERLVTASEELDTVSISLEGAISSTDDAATACEATGLTSLTSAIQNLREEIAEAHERATQAQGDVDAEQAEAHSWTNTTDDEESAL